ncbi:hypothetical protein NADE_004121 [Nannochloris sp. 'desiccata']|nr:hypothetical protein KSW81_001161 [Chlorella desiccata (nom. nud.)]KAH7617719.1 hypothetical protein NADE_004121 [Chlorella desiccata (nom. nud.)]
MARFNALIALVAILLFLSAVGTKTSFIPRRALNGAEISNVQPGDVDGFRELLGRGGSRGGSRGGGGGGGGGGSEENPVIVNFSVHVSCSFTVYVSQYEKPCSSLVGGDEQRGNGWAVPAIAVRTTASGTVIRELVLLYFGIINFLQKYKQKKE